jgi:hypothetical protein
VIQRAESSCTATTQSGSTPSTATTVGPSCEDIATTPTSVVGVGVRFAQAENTQTRCTRMWTTPSLDLSLILTIDVRNLRFRPHHRPQQCEETESVDATGTGRGSMPLTAAGPEIDREGSTSTSTSAPCASDLCRLRLFGPDVRVCEPIIFVAHLPYRHRNQHPLHTKRTRMSFQRCAERTLC